MSRLHTFLVAPSEIHGDTAIIGGDKAKQISNVLRLGVGDSVRLIDGIGNEYLTEISEFCVGGVSVRIVKSGPCDADETLRIVVAVCMPKNDKLEWIVQKCTELGVARVVVCQSARAVPTLTDDRIDRRLARWKKIAEEAAEQCGRATVPEIDGVFTFLEMASEVRNCDVTLVACGSHEQLTIRDALASAGSVCDSVSVVIGPEGGLTVDEVAQLVELGAVSVTLGRRTLRTETAAVAAVATILSHIGTPDHRESA